MAEARKWRLGIIGVGKIARDQHLPAIAENPDFDLVAVSNLLGPPPPGAEVFADFSDMLARRPDLDAVAICTPPQVRAGVARAALAAGQHVLLEKPPATSLGALADLSQLAASHGRVLFTAWHSQFNAAVIEARRLLADQRIETLAVLWKEDVRRWHPGQQWIWHPGGFGVFDHGINALSILTSILPQRLVIEAADLLYPPGFQVPIAASLRFAGQGMAAEIDWRPEAGQIREITITTAAGMHLHLSESGSRLDVGGTRVIDGPRAEYADIYRHFSTLLRGGASDIDPQPLQLVADAFLLGRRVEVAAFDPET